MENSMDKKASPQTVYWLKAQSSIGPQAVQVKTVGLGGNRLRIGNSMLDEQMWHQLQDAAKQLGWPSTGDAEVPRWKPDTCYMPGSTVVFDEAVWVRVCDE